MTRARNSADLASQGNLFADISNDRIGIGSVVPTHKLHVAGTSKFDDDVKFEGTTAARNIIWDKSDNKLKFSDNTVANFGGGNDLQIWHDGGGHNYIRATDSTRNYIQHGTNNAIITYPNAAVELYHNHSKKLETLSTGAKVTGNLEVTGVLTYDDVTSIDSVGIITARDHIHINADNKQLKIGAHADGDLLAYHDGTKSVIVNYTGDFHLRSNNGSRSSNEGIILKPNGSTELYHSGNKKFETTSSGVTVNGNVYVAGSQNAQLTTNQLIFDRAGYSYIDQINNAGSLVFRVTSSNTIGLRIDSNAQAIFGSSLIIPDAIQHEGDLDCKIRFPGTDTITFETASNERLRITSDGKVGINETNPGTHLHVEQDNAHGSTYWLNSDAAILVDNKNASGKAVIKLEHDAAFVYGGGSSTLIFADRENERLRIVSDGRIFTSGRTSYSGNTTCDDLVVGDGSGHRGIAISSGSSSEGGIHFGDGESGNTSYRGILAYNHADDSMQFRTAASERLRIDSVGRLGINVTNAGSYYSAADDLIIREKDGGDSGLTIRTGTANSGLICFADGASATNNQYRRGQIRYHHNSDSMDFTTGGNTARLTITSAGLIGIGNDSPGELLSLRHASSNTVLDLECLAANDGSTGNIIKFRGKGANGVSYHAAQIKGITENAANNAGFLSFWTNSAGTVAEKLRIDSNGDLGLGIFPAVPQDSGAKTLHIHHPDTSGSTARAGLRLTTGISGSAASNGGFLGLDYSNNFYLYNQENGDLRVGTNGTERLRITSGGQVNIGGDYTQTSRFVNINGGSTVGQLQLKGTEADIWLHSTGANGKWRILGSSGNNTHAFRIYDQTNSAERLRITNTGKIGMGIDSPYLDKVCIKNNVSAGTHNWALHLLNGTHASDSRIGLAFQANNNAASNTWDGSGIYAANDGTTGACHTMFGTVINGSFTERLRITSSGHLKILGQGQTTGFYLTNSYGQAGIFGGMFFNGSSWVRDAHSSRLGAGMYINTGGHVVFLKAPENSGTSATVTESARISSSGYLGINTNSPQRYLHIVGNDGASGATSGNSDTQLVIDNTGTNGAMMEFLSATNGAGHIMFTDTGAVNRGRFSYHHDGDYFRFDTAGDERLRLLSTGRMGLGISSPEAVLHPRANTSHGTDTAFQVGTGNRFFKLDELSGQDNFGQCYMSFYDNSLREILTLKNEYAGQTGMGMEIAWRGYSGGKTGDIRVYNTAVNSGQSKMDMSASGGVGIEIDHNGHVTKPNQPYCDVTLDTSRTCGSRGVHRFSDSGGFGGHYFTSVRNNVGSHYSSSNSRFTVPVTGNYLICMNIALSNSNPDAYLAWEWYRNGSRGWYGGWQRAESSGYHRHGTSTIWRLTKDDYLEPSFETDATVTFLGHTNSNSRYTGFSIMLLA